MSGMLVGVTSLLEAFLQIIVPATILGDLRNDIVAFALPEETVRSFLLVIEVVAGRLRVLQVN